MSTTDRVVDLLAWSTKRAQKALSDASTPPPGTPTPLQKNPLAWATGVIAAAIAQAYEQGRRDALAGREAP